MSTRVLTILTSGLLPPGANLRPSRRTTVAPRPSYDKHCVRHGAEVYTKETRQGTFPALQNQVRRCEMALGLIGTIKKFPR